MKNKAIFLDRDGTINIDHGYVYEWDNFEFISGVPETLKRLKEEGFLLIVLTNQSGVARGYYNEEHILKLHCNVNSFLENRYGFVIDKFYYCPHHIDGTIEKYKVDCKCRKPKIGMLEQAVDDFDIELDDSFMVGDKDSDNILPNKLKFIKVNEKDTLEHYLTSILQSNKHNNEA